MPERYNMIQLEDNFVLRKVFSRYFKREGRTHLGCEYLEDYINSIKDGNRADVYLLDNKGFRFKGSPKEMLAKQAIDITKILVPDARIILYSSEPNAETLAWENGVYHIEKDPTTVINVAKQIINDYL